MQMFDHNAHKAPRWDKIQKPHASCDHSGGGMGKTEQCL